MPRYEWEFLAHITEAFCFIVFSLSLACILLFQEPTCSLPNPHAMDFDDEEFAMIEFLIAMAVKKSDQPCSISCGIISGWLCN